MLKDSGRWSDWSWEGYCCINDALKKTTLSLWLRKCECGGQLHEPDYIAALCLDFPNRLADILKRIYTGYSFSISGIYCHQKPLADFSEIKGSCEIGDLLLVYVFEDSNRKRYFNSLLLQAKKLEYGKDKAPISLRESENLQLKLYSEWPKFRYSRAGSINGKECNIVPKVFSSGAKYLLINPYNALSLPKDPEYCYGVSMAHAPLFFISSDPFFVELIEFIHFRTGRIFEERPEDRADKDSWTKDEWSKMIWNMIDILKDEKSKRKNIGKTSFPRITTAGNILYFVQKFDTDLPYLLGDFDKGHIDADDCDTGDDFGCLPTIIIEARESDS
jgi:hypothetical protein